MSISATYADHQQKLKYFSSPAGRIAYLDEGSGPCLLLLHGVPTSSWLYRKIYPALVQAGYRTIVPDMLGFGSSDKPKGYEIYAPAAVGRQLLALMEHLQIDRWTHVFHDAGGLWTWGMLQLNSLKVERLIMLNTIVYQAGFRPPLKFEKGLLAKSYAKLYSFGFGQNIVLNATFKKGVKDKSLLSKAMLEGYKKPLLKHGHRAMYYFFTQTCREITDFTALHKSLNIPITVIWGKEDEILLWDAIAVKVKEHLQVSPQDIHLLRAKHFIQEEQPTEMVNHILGSL